MLTRAGRSTVLLGLLFAAGEAVGSTWPTVSSIRFEGNRVTREEVMLREFSLRVGAPADPVEIEHTRQALLDLELFRDVQIDAEPATDGVALVVRLREKRYLLPIPRIDTSSDGELNLGGQLRWSNVGGRNHSLNLLVERGDYEDNRIRESERSARVSYRAPYFLESSFGLAVIAERIDRDVPNATGGYEESIDRVQVLLQRDLRRGRPRAGWILGGGVFGQRQQTAGEFAPVPDGTATALVGTAEYSDVRFRVYSENGQRFRSRIELADDAWSDYDYRLLTADYTRYLPLEGGPHRSLHLIAEGGIRQDGPGRRNQFYLGGSSRLRGYPSQTFGGERFYRLSAEYLRPLWRPSVRLLLLAEVGGTSGDLENFSASGTHASLGLGVRIRFTRFVGVEIELGVAYPLKGGEGARVFAGGL